MPVLFSVPFFQSPGISLHSAQVISTFRGAECLRKHACLV